MSGDYVALLNMEPNEGDVLGKLPEGVRSLVCHNLTYREKVRFGSATKTLAFCEDTAGLRKLRDQYFTELDRREAADSQQVRSFFWKVVKMILVAVASMTFLGCVGLYCYHYGDLYLGRSCDYPIAATLRKYGKCALIMCGMLLMLQLVVQWPIIEKMIPNCFRRSKDHEFFDLEAGEVIDEVEEYGSLLDYSDGRLYMPLMAIFFCWVFSVWVIGIVAMWNAIHLFYYVINSEKCDADLYDAAYFFCMIPVVFYMVICFFQSCVVGYLRFR